MDRRIYLCVSIIILAVIFGVTSTYSATVSKGITSRLDIHHSRNDISTIEGNRETMESRNLKMALKEEDSTYLKRVGWPSFRAFERLRRDNGEEKVLFNSNDVGKSLDSRQFLTSNAEHGDQEDSSSRKSNINIWLTLLIAAVAAAIFS